MASHLLGALEEFQSLGVDFVSLHEANETSCRPKWRHCAGCVVQLEGSIIAGRVRAGQRAAKRRAVRLGRPSIEVHTRSAL
jgi:DNA invertase Pin-like site-specific DNA recombinase